MVISLKIHASEFEKISIVGFEKEILSERQIRFFNKKNPSLVLHIQVDRFNHEESWTEKNLKKDINKMFENRKTIYGIFGFSNIEFSDYSLTSIGSNNTHQVLTILGKYNKLSNKNVYFMEKNIYFNENFLQIKIIKENTKITNEEIELYTNQIHPLEVDIK
jgi:hypothetical protein